MSSRSEGGPRQPDHVGFGCFSFSITTTMAGSILLVADFYIGNEIEKSAKARQLRVPRTCSAILAAGKFEEATQKLGREFATPRVARGAAYADIDNDGALDVLMTTNAGRPSRFDFVPTSFTRRLWFVPPSLRKSQRPSAIGRHQDVERTVVVDVGIGCAARHSGVANAGPTFCVASSNLPPPRLRNKCGGSA